METMKPWIEKRITELLGTEDELINDFVYNQLDGKVHTYVYIYTYLHVHSLWCLFSRENFRAVTFLFYNVIDIVSDGLVIVFDEE